MKFCETRQMNTCSYWDAVEDSIDDDNDDDDGGFLCIASMREENSITYVHVITHATNLEKILINFTFQKAFKYTK